MGELVSYLLRLILAAIIGAAISLLFGTALFLIVGAIETSGGPAAPESFVVVIGFGAFISGLVTTRFIWARWLRPKDRKLEYWRRVAEQARRGQPPSVNATTGGGVQLIVDGLAIRQASKRVEVKWSDVSEIRVRTFRGLLAGPQFMIITNDGRKVAFPQEEVPPDVLERMQRLPDFRNDALIEAMGSMDDAEFSCWRQAKSAT